jgi:hypothetical protein
LDRAIVEKWCEDASTKIPFLKNVRGSLMVVLEEWKVKTWAHIELGRNGSSSGFVLSDFKAGNVPRWVSMIDPEEFPPGNAAVYST